MNFSFFVINDEVTACALSNHRSKGFMLSAELIHMLFEAERS